MRGGGGGGSSAVLLGDYFGTRLSCDWWGSQHVSLHHHKIALTALKIKDFPFSLTSQFLLHPLQSFSRDLETYPTSIAMLWPRSFEVI